MFCVTVIVCCLHLRVNLDLLRHVLQKLHLLLEVVLDNVTEPPAASRGNATAASRVSRLLRTHLLPPFPAYLAWPVALFFPLL
jgi:hypothetical protein